MIFSSIHASRSQAIGFIKAHSCAKPLKTLRPLQARILKSEQNGIVVQFLHPHENLLSTEESAELRAHLEEVHQFLIGLPGDHVVIWTGEPKISPSRVTSLKISVDFVLRRGFWRAEILNPELIPGQWKTYVEDTTQTLLSQIQKDYQRMSDRRGLGLTVKHRGYILIPSS